MKKIVIDRIVGRSKTTAYPKEFTTGDHVKITFELIVAHETNNHESEINIP